MKFDTTKKFERQFRKLPENIRDKFAIRIVAFGESPHDPRLRLHKLSGIYKDAYSINITGDIRLIMEIVSPTQILLVAIGSHSELYS